MKGHTPSSVSISRQSPFLVEQGSWYNFYISVYSNRLPAHIALAAMLLVVGFIFSTPLSLFATIPMLYYITEVNMQPWKQDSYCVAGKYRGEFKYWSMGSLHDHQLKKKPAVYYLFIHECISYTQSPPSSISSNILTRDPSSKFNLSMLYLITAKWQGTQSQI